METKTEFERLGLFDAKVPRYTSYPPATRFSEAVGPAQLRDWIAAIAPGSQISLYLHVPFCRRLCWFCACRTQGTPTLAPLTRYLELLETEIDLLAGVLPRGVGIARIHWGGGTPTLLDAAMIERLAGRVARLAPLASDAEFSVEIDPNEIGPERVAALVNAGMTRASIGVQDFDPVIQKVIGRQQSFEVTQAAVDLLRDAGVASLNADLLYGLPHQTQPRIADSINKLMSLRPDRIALYGYAHVPWMARRQTLIPSDALPTPRERLDLFETARRMLVWDGYREIGIDHFALPQDRLAQAARTGSLRRNFQGYTDDTNDVLIGLGASAISRFPQGYAQNAPVTSRYDAAISRNAFATARGHVFAGDDHLRGRMIEALMCDFAIHLDDIPGDRDAARKLMARTALAFGGVLDWDGDRLRIPASARPLTRMVARYLDAYAIERGRHAPAI